MKADKPTDPLTHINTRTNKPVTAAEAAKLNAHFPGRCRKRTPEDSKPFKTTNAPR